MKTRSHGGGKTQAPVREDESARLRRFAHRVAAWGHKMGAPWAGPGVGQALACVLTTDSYDVAPVATCATFRVVGLDELCVELSREGGVELAEELRQGAARRWLPVVVVTVAKRLWAYCVPYGVL